MRPIWIIILSLAVLIAIGGAGWYFFAGGGGSISSQQSAAAVFGPTTNLSSAPHREAPAGSTEYHNIHYHLSLFYPASLSVKEIVEGIDTATITFQNPKEEKGFQIFVVPYDKPQISSERFKKDVPSGVRDNPTDVTVAGTPGAAFYSKDAALGDTYEVWFIKGGILYEVTTPKSLEGWLENILQTWEFI